MRRTGVSAEQLDQRFDTVDFDRLSEITVRYRKYGFRLKLSEQDIEEIEHDPNLIHSAKDKTAAVFKEWYRKNPPEATYHALLAVAVELGDGAMAEKICQLSAASEKKGNLFNVCIWLIASGAILENKVWEGAKV